MSFRKYKPVMLKCTSCPSYLTLKGAARCRICLLRSLLVLVLETPQKCVPLTTISKIEKIESACKLWSNHADSESYHDYLILDGPFSICFIQTNRMSVLASSFVYFSKSGDLMT